MKQPLIKFFNDIKRYGKYALIKAKTDLKTDVSGSYLGCLWWVLDPMFFMIVYTFVSVIVFKTTEPYFSAFIFIGSAVFKFFDKTVKKSVKLIPSNRNIIKNIYIPKPVMLMSSMYVTCFEFFISFGLVLASMLLYRVPLTYRFLHFIPLFFLLLFFSYGCGLILMHCGVYVEDLYNVVNIALHLMMYMSGVFFSIPNRISNKILMNCLLKLNPVAFIINQLRVSLLYGGDSDIKTYIIWLIISVFINIFGIYLVYKNESSYVKMLK